MHPAGPVPAVLSSHDLNRARAINFGLKPGRVT